MHSKLQEIEDYRNSDALNQSFLKACGANDLKVKKNDSETIATMRGSLTDVLTLTPELQDEFYYFSKLDKAPPPQIKECLDNAFEITSEWDLTLLLEQFRLVSNLKSKDDVILEKIKAWEEYWQDLIDGQGKKIITQDYWNICNNARNILLTHPFTKHHFENTLFADIQYQIPIYDTIEFVVNGITYTVDRKGLLDFFIIDEVHKTVQFKDLKTTSSTPTEWFKYARQFRYDFQVAWYYDIIQNLFPDYRQLMPELVVYSFAAPNKPFTKVMTIDDLHMGRNGCNIQKSFVEYDGGIVEPITERIMGWEECLSRYLIKEENGWIDYDADYWNSNGLVTKNIW